MNPALAAVLEQLAAKGVSLGLAAIERFANDLLTGKAVDVAAQDLAMWAAEQQALLVDQVAGQV